MYENLSDSKVAEEYCPQLLHSHFIKKDRKKKEEAILKTGQTFQQDGAFHCENKIWITTSIVEASLDIDFDYLFTELLDLIEQQNVSFSYVEMGDVFKVGGATIRVLGPAKNTYSDLNDTSLLLQFTYGKHSFLFCGDATSLEEKDVLKTGVDLSSTVLAVAHHGSNTSTSSAFLSAVNPIYAINSVGADNSYGHPHQETLQKLDQIGTQVFTTMNSGTVLFETDGTAMVYYTQKE